MRKLPASLAAFATFFAATAQAHGGHGIGHEAHWHASDAWGFLLAGLVVAALLWFGRGGK